MRAKSKAGTQGAIEMQSESLVRTSLLFLSLCGSKLAGGRAAACESRRLPTEVFSWITYATYGSVVFGKRFVLLL